MASVKSNLSVESFPMNAGDGIYSYSHNSSMQRRGIDVAMKMIDEVITEKLNVEELLSSSSIFRIADLGCSVGPNTYFVVERIIKSIKLKCLSQDLDLKNLDFQAFLNDQVANDFNMLFKSIPTEKDYHIAAVPGSFHGRLFPRASLQFIHSSYALQWLSRVPPQVTEEGSSTWNEGRIHTANAPKQVVEAYHEQFVNDLEIFLNARAAELVSGGLMAILIPSTPTCSNSTLDKLVQLLESALMDLVSSGLLCEEKFHSFNLPLYHPTMAEMEALVKQNRHFNIERMDLLVRPPPLEASEVMAKMTVMHFRAGWEGLIKAHFGSEIVDPIFEHFLKKVKESSVFVGASYNQKAETFILLKRL